MGSTVSVDSVPEINAPSLTVSAIVAEIDAEKDSTIDYTEIRAEPISEIRQ